MRKKRKRYSFFNPRIFANNKIISGERNLRQIFPNKQLKSSILFFGSLSVIS